MTFKTRFPGLCDDKPKCLTRREPVAEAGTGWDTFRQTGEGLPAGEKRVKEEVRCVNPELVARFKQDATRPQSSLLG